MKDKLAKAQEKQDTAEAPQLDSQQPPEAIVRGARQTDQLEHMQENANAEKTNGLTSASDLSGH
jgi:hypothetical protein